MSLTSRPIEFFPSPGHWPTNETAAAFVASTDFGRINSLDRNLSRLTLGSESGRGTTSVFGARVRKYSTTA